MADLTIEQQQALALAQARRKRAEAERSAQSQAGHARADEIAGAMMGLDASPEAQGVAQAHMNPKMALEGVEDSSLPFIGSWADEIAGVTNIPFGGYDEGKRRSLARDAEIQRIRPDEAARAKTVGIAKGLPLAAVGGPQLGAAKTATGLVARGAAQGAIAGGIEGASSGAGAADDRLAGAVAGGIEGAKIGALFGGVAAGAVGIGSKGFRALFARSQQRPTVDQLRAVKNKAYKDVDEAGEVFSGEETVGLFERVQNRLANSNYVPGVDRQTDAALSLLERRSGRDITLGQLDKVRQNLWKRYRAAENEVDILDIIDEIDGMVSSRAATSELMDAARLANSRFKKSELLSNAFDKAELQTASTGSGGNILNKYRQAVTRILTNPREIRYFDETEVAAMRTFVEGDLSENVLRKIGKLSPNGNGLMQALNLAAIAVNPNAIAASAAATGAKAVADRSVQRGAEDLLDLVATGQVRQPMRIAPAGSRAAGVYGSSSER